MDVRSFLLENIVRDGLDYWGERDRSYLRRIAEDWLATNGRGGSLYRLEKISMLLPGASRILDMGAGCGTFVHFALAQGFDAYGIEPESWKLEVVRRKVRESGYDRSFAQRIVGAVGETLPFASDSFDCVTTFQTIEHVQDIHACCTEMLRVTRPGGAIYIRCPDYSLATWEGHYRLPWLPGLRGKWARRYLALCRKPVAGLQSLQPVSARMLRRVFAALGGKKNVRLRIVNVDYFRVLRFLHLPDNPLGFVLTRPVFIVQFLRVLFRSDYPVHLCIFVDEK
jgi:2-polyprenyl-3-methyl-5-hydroxy-6-metoxy-1,4-benzoquinol methylase